MLRCCIAVELTSDTCFYCVLWVPRAAIQRGYISGANKIIHTEIDIGREREKNLKRHAYTIFTIFTLCARFSVMHHLMQIQLNQIESNNHVYNNSLSQTHEKSAKKIVLLMIEWEGREKSQNGRGSGKKYDRFCGTKTTVRRMFRETKKDVFFSLCIAISAICIHIQHTTDEADDDVPLLLLHLIWLMAYFFTVRVLFALLFSHASLIYIIHLCSLPCTECFFLFSVCVRNVYS